MDFYRGSTFKGIPNVWIWHLFSENCESLFVFFKVVLFIFSNCDNKCIESAYLQYYAVSIFAQKFLLTKYFTGFNRNQIESEKCERHKREGGFSNK